MLRPSGYKVGVCQCTTVPASLAEVMGYRKLWSELVRTLYSLIKEVKTSP